MKNKIEHLRDHLFETLEALKDKDHPMDLDRAKAIAGVGQVIVNSAKVENEFLKITGSNGSGFISEAAATPPALPALPNAGQGQPRLVRGRAQSGSS